MNTFPKHLVIANLPTKIEKLEKLSIRLGQNIYIMRDDQTGMEVSGNKVRKLEYAIYEAVETGCQTIITCGGIQSNHARATAAIAKKLGMKVILVLRSDEESPAKEGNYLMNLMFGAECRLVSQNDFIQINDLMDEIAREEEMQGRKAYIIPVGASCGIGNFGYINAIKEIHRQELEMGIKFDAIACTIGSGGTYAGLYLGNEYFDLKKDIIGINICENKLYFKGEIKRIIDESKLIAPKLNIVSANNIIIKDGYTSGGYAINEFKDFEVIKEFAQEEGIILDPVYTGKAMKGLIEEIKKGDLSKYENILFIHTGGIFGVFSKAEKMFPK